MSAGSIDSWGPALWRFLHASSFAFPEEPDAVRQMQMLEFLKSVGRVLPCKTCREHYTAYLEEHLDERVVASRTALVEWLVALHNDVNRRTGKKEWTVDEVRQLYEARGPSGSCPARRKKPRIVAPLAWIVAVVLLAALGLIVTAQVRRIPN